jgi:signal transduction histidine kinase
MNLGTKEFETKSKEIRCLLVNASTRRDAENKIVGVVGRIQQVLTNVITNDIKYTTRIGQTGGSGLPMWPLFTAETHSPC